MAKTYLFWDPLEDNVVRETDEAGVVTAEYTTEPEQYGNVISQPVAEVMLVLMLIQINCNCCYSYHAPSQSLRPARTENFEAVHVLSLFRGLGSQLHHD